MGWKENLSKFFEWEYGAKTMAFALLSLCLTAAFAVMNGVIAILEKSVWYGALAAYYVLLMLFRGTTIGVARAGKKRLGDTADYKKLQNRIYLGCGAFLVLIELAMCGAVTQMVLFVSPVNGGRIYAIATAVYAFYKITTAIVNLVRAKRYADPVSQSLRNLNFADACMSMVSLTVLLLNTFGKEDEGALSLALKACVGFAACAAVLFVAAVIIAKAAKRLKAPHGEENE